MGNKKPKLIAFDLDYTLWPFRVDTHLTPPFTKGAQDNIVDAVGARVSCYPEVPQVLKQLFEDDYTLAAASRTGEKHGAFQLLDLFGWNEYFSYKEIYPSSKVKHFNQFRKQSGIEFDEMLFFDDDCRNIAALERIGVVSVLVKNGVNTNVIEEGLAEYARRP
ncbi:magnesium-dependent phosphatase 1 isoform X2 [Agrilus planipennis]|uniref:Magnesium-dependent phosphatase 1 isoform X2 n=1 Tax=Agrilus planipennis TaxID=224129 RepID=A0A1W4WGU9_AGRPL|nr:magnesium-dependent phosphatase 1 isoform X2 [Agrilus planipennis]